MMEDRVPAHDPLAERTLIATVAYDSIYVPDLKRLVRADEFYVSQHRELINAIYELSETNYGVEPATIQAWLYDHGRQQHAGGVEAVANLLDTAPTTPDPLPLARRIAMLAAVRRVDLTGRKIAVEARGPMDDISSWLDTAVDQVQSAADVRRLLGRDTTATAREVVQDVHRVVMDRAAKFKEGEESAPGLSTGFSMLDYRIGRLARGGVTILGAESGVGKTGFGLAIASNVAHHGHGVAYTTLELPREELVERLLVAHSGVPSDAIFVGDLLSEDYVELAAAMAAIARLPFVLDDASVHTASTLRGFLRRAAQKIKQPIELWVVDYLQLVQAATRHGASENEIIGDVSKSLLEIAKDFNIAILALAQFNRDRKHRGKDQPPIVTDIYGSGQIEKDARAIILLQEISEIGDDPSTVIAHVHKGRAGSHKGTVEFQYRKSEAKWFEMERQYESAYRRRQKPSSAPDSDGFQDGLR